LKIPLFTKLNHILGELPLPIPKFERFKRKTAKKKQPGEPAEIDWVEVTSTLQLPDEDYFENALGENYRRQPFIHPENSKNLSTPLTTFHAFLDPVLLESILHSTNENIRSQNVILVAQNKPTNKTTTLQELHELIFSLMAMKVSSSDHSEFDNNICILRDVLLRHYGINAKWPNSKRLQFLRTHLRAYGENDNNLENPELDLNTRKVEKIVESFEKVNKNVMGSQGAYVLDETLCAYHGRCGLYCRMDRKPAKEGVLVHNVCKSHSRFSENILLGRTFSEKKMDKPILVEKLIGEKIKNLGLLLCADRGYSTIKMIRYCNTNMIPFIGCIQNRWLSGNYPIFEKDNSKAQLQRFQKRSYCFRAKNEKIYFTAIYDYEAHVPVIIISNFHTREMSQKIHGIRPQTSEIYNKTMAGVDLFDKVTFASDISRKTNRWTTRFAENMFSFLLTNCKTSYCVFNNIPLHTMTHDTYFLEVLKERYGVIENVSCIYLDAKLPLLSRRICNWDKCKSKTIQLCANRVCNKICCENHLAAICFDCYEDHKIRHSNLTLVREKHKVQKRCEIASFCRKKSTITCARAECNQYVCKFHRHNLCLDCCTYWLRSDENNNFSKKVHSKDPKKC
jgi:hypothetical protein